MNSGDESWSGGIREVPRRHPGGTLETPRRHLGGTQGSTQEAPGVTKRYPKGTQRHPGGSEGTRGAFEQNVLQPSCLTATSSVSECLVSTSATQPSSSLQPAHRSWRPTALHKRHQACTTPSEEPPETWSVNNTRIYT